MRLLATGSGREGIVHVIGPELGLTQPGMTIVCGDSHTSTHGAFGALAFGIGTSEVEHVLATQTLPQALPKTMRVTFAGELPLGLSAKDMVLAAIGQIGVAGGQGHVIEYAGLAIEALSMEGRMTICNMSIEAGARAGMIAPDEVTFRLPRGPARRSHRRGVGGGGRRLARAAHRRRRELRPRGRGRRLEPEAAGHLGHEPRAWSRPSTASCPTRADFADPAEREAVERALAYMDLAPGTPLVDIRIDKVFIGSCTNARIEDLRVAAKVVSGKQVAGHVRAIVVPGSAQVKRQAEAEGLRRGLQGSRVRVAPTRAARCASG